ncbi:hypothetical protein EW146_g6643 [Bondarzewia mesenterica]|uniref:Zn(2)-C6 fungal-type domain-containing protein n=1 Tax=Bondarzewia mesenterica TaxID=1095465 RepID=A0A4S4LNL8_9AGAM|nr:hypothetical protein EW146_g6643 [Bondarzewia mesenterica]
MALNATLLPPTARTSFSPTHATNAPSTSTSMIPPPPELEQTLTLLSGHRSVLGYLLLSRGHPVSIIRHSGVVFEGEQGRKYATAIGKMVEGVQAALIEVSDEPNEGDEIRFMRIRTKRHEIMISPVALMSSSAFSPLPDKFPTPRLSGRLPDDAAHSPLATRGTILSRSISAPSSDSFSADWSAANLHFPHPAQQWDQRLLSDPRLDLSVSSGTSPSICSSPSLTSNSSSSAASEADEAWNLIPYHVSWGHEYEEYRAGTLPGPEGDCIFLRSPTPLKNQRATEACKKCRERKAKCSGARPSCARCTSRGYTCQYASETQPENGPSKNRRRRREAAAVVASVPKVHVMGKDIAPEKDYPALVRDMPVKHEDDVLALAYAHMGASASPAAASWEGSTPSDELAVDDAWQFPHEHASSTSSDDDMFIAFHDPALAAGHAYPGDEFQHLNLPAATADSSIFAPRPLRHLSSTSLLSTPGDHMTSSSAHFPSDVTLPQNVAFPSSLSSQYTNSMDNHFHPSSSSASEDSHGLQYDFSSSYVASTMSPQFFSAEPEYVSQSQQHADPYKLASHAVYQKALTATYTDSDAASQPQFPAYPGTFLASTYTPFPRGS